MNKEFTIIMLAGYSCSGKTTLGEVFCNSKKIDRIHQRDIYQKIAKDKGYDQARDWLSDVGRSNFIEETIEGVIACIKEIKPIKAVLIDETYNTTSIERIREEFPESRIAVASVEASEEIRSTRISGRVEGYSISNMEKELGFRDTFLREAGLDEVMDRAEVQINNTGFIERSSADLSQKLEELGISL